MTLKTDKLYQSVAVAGDLVNVVPDSFQPHGL